jgi:hypothetical protein
VFKHLWSRLAEHTLLLADRELIINVASQVVAISNHCAVLVLLVSSYSSAKHPTAATESAATAAAATWPWSWSAG